MKNVNKQQVIALSKSNTYEQYFQNNPIPSFCLEEYCLAWKRLLLDTI